MSVLDLARADLRTIAPYSSARMEASGGSVMLNANENPWPPHGDGGLALNRYPDPQPAELVVRLAGLYGVAPDQLLLGRGSDELIDLLTRAFCRAGQDQVLISPPTFGMYAVCASIQGAAVIEVALDAAQDFALDPDALLAAVTPNTRLVYVCSPNNPTGGAVALADIGELAARLRDRAVLVVDEAYAEFSTSPSAATLLSRHDNLAVLRTLSKAHALAGARIGALIATPEVIELLRRIIAPYPLPAGSVHAALQGLGNAALSETRQRVAMLRAERERLCFALLELPLVRKVWPSAANFLTVRFDDAGAVYRRLRDAGIVLRNVGHYPGLDDCLRISIGRPDENQRLLAALRAPVEGS